MIQRHRTNPGLKRRLALLGLAATGLAYVLGLVAFVSALEDGKSEAKRADAIIALTGGDARLAKAMELLGNGRGKRLLITGVNDAVTRDQLYEQAGGKREAFDCCVDLGHGAENTIGNAYEAAEWAKRNGYKSLIVVTAAYHMPRSQMELAAAMPEVRLIVQPVFPDRLDTNNWWNDRQSAWVLLGEYTKYLFAWGRISLLEPLGVRFAPAVPAKINYGEAVPGGEPNLGYEPAHEPGT